MNPDWQLSKQFTFDGNGIRCACVLPPTTENASSNRIICGTQGGRLYQVTLNENGNDDFCALEFQHNHAITSIAAFQEGEPGKEIWKYATGCKDAVVRIFDANTNALLHELKGHEKPVTSMDIIAGVKPILLTASWDGTAKLWQGTKLIATLSGHENSVCIAGISLSDNGQTVLVATGSAGEAQNNVIVNHAIRIWQVNLTTSQVQLLHHVKNDHDGPIRSLALLQQEQEQYLASCSNDGTVHIRSTQTGTSAMTLSAVVINMPILLHLCALGDGMAVAAEDGHVIIWNQGSDVQQEPSIIAHPSCVWTVYPLVQTQAVDLITCCQDGFLRIFTQALERVAPPAVMEEFTQAVSVSTQAKTKGPPPEEVAKLPLWEDRHGKIGKSDGQVQLFNKDNVAIAAQWATASRTWIEVGQVMGSSEAGGNVVDGVQYDHVFPIEVDRPDGNGTTKLRIGYNNGENPFVAAQRFIDAHVLPQYHLQEIANYITQQTSSSQRGPTLGGGGPSTTASVMPILQHLPNRTLKTFGMTKSTDLSKVLDRLYQAHDWLSDGEKEALKTMTNGLQDASSSSPLPSESCVVLMKILSESPPVHAFAALDLFRFAILHAPTIQDWSWSKILHLAAAQCRQASSASGTSDADAKTLTIAIPMLTLRFFVNACKSVPDAVDFELALGLTQLCASSGNKNVRLSVATLWMNLATLLHSQKDQKQQPQVVELLVNQIYTTVFSSPTSKLYKKDASETMVRVLWALGTTLVAYPTQAKAAMSSRGMWSHVERLASGHGSLAMGIAKEIYRIQNPNLGF